MSRFTDCTTGTITRNNQAIQLYFNVRFSRSPRNPLQGVTEYVAFCDSGVVVVVPSGQIPEFPLEVDPPDDDLRETINANSNSP